MKKGIFSVVTVVALTISMVIPAWASASPTTQSVEDDVRAAMEADGFWPGTYGNAQNAASYSATNAASGSASSKDAVLQNDTGQSRMGINVAEGSAKTTLEESIDLAGAATVDPVALSGGASLIAEAADPAAINLAKTDMTGNYDIVTALGRMRIGMTYGTPTMIGAGKLSASDGRAIKSQTINIDINGLKSAKGVAILCYTMNANGVRVPRVIKPNFSKGKLKVKLPVPCEYTVIFNKTVQ